jgi:hypothetical protein
VSAVSVGPMAFPAFRATGKRFDSLSPHHKRVLALEMHSTTL